MIFLWCILVTTCIGVCFKLFAKWEVNTFNAIVINYTVCLALGTILDPAGNLPFSSSILGASWFKYDLVLGLLFIIGFNLSALAIQKAGITMTTLIQRMSILLTVSFTVLVFHEHFGWLEGIGLIFALLAILFMNMKKTGTNDLFSSPSKFFLLLVLACSSSIEILLFYVEKTGLVGQEQVTFTSHGFGIAAAFGWLVLAFTWFKGKIRITLKDVFAGFMLGVPNFFSIYFLLLMLNKGWNGSIMYPLVNVSVLLCSTAVAVMAFSEKLTKLNWIGILMATAAILTIAYAQNASDWKISF